MFIDLYMQVVIDTSVSTSSTFRIERMASDWHMNHQVDIDQIDTSAVWL